MNTAAPAAPLNRLAGEKSPYLLQHAHNPVDWYPWGPEAFEKARREEKPIFLSVGYSTCHWCHVMAHESFENPEIGEADERALRQHQSRPRGAPGCGPSLHDLRAGDDGQRRLADERFSDARTQAVHRRHLLPAGRSLGRPGFPTVLNRSRRAWKNDRENIVDHGNTVAEQLREYAASSAPTGPGRKAAMAACFDQLDSDVRRRTRRLRRSAEISATAWRSTSFSAPTRKRRGFPGWQSCARNGAPHAAEDGGRRNA